MKSNRHRGDERMAEDLITMICGSTRAQVDVGFGNGVVNSIPEGRKEQSSLVENYIVRVIS